MPLILRTSRRRLAGRASVALITLSFWVSCWAWLPSYAANRRAAARARPDQPDLVWTGRGLSLPLGTGAPEVSDPRPAPGIRILNGGMVQLLQRDFPWRATRLLIPALPEVSKWLEVGVRDGSLCVKQFPVGPSPDGFWRLHVYVIGKEPLLFDGVEVHGVYAEVRLPWGAFINDCIIEWPSVTMDGVGPVRALRIVCPVAPDIIFRGGATRVIFALCWPIITAVILGIIPTVKLPGFWWWFSGIAMFCILIKLLGHWRSCLHWLYRHQLYHELRALIRQGEPVEEAYWKNEVCCICLADLEQPDSLIVLLPCKHVVHRDCYVDWVHAPSYPSLDFLCPLCNQHAESLGRLAQPPER